MSRTLKLIAVWSFFALAGAAYACGGDDGGSNGGTGGSGATDSGTTCGPTPLGFPATCKSGAPPECCDATLPVMKKRDSAGNLLDPDWSCITGSGAGTGGGGNGDSGVEAGLTDGGLALDGGSGDAGSAQNTFVVQDFSGGAAVADIEVELYEGESVIGKTAFLTAFTKGTEHPGTPELNVGEFYFPHPASPYLSYRVKEKPGVAKEFVGFGYSVPPAPGKVIGNTLSPTLYAELAKYAVTLPGWSPPEDLAILTGPIRDCKGDDVGGARVRFFEEDTGKEIEPGTCARDVRYIYFDSQYPNLKCSYSDYRQSLFLIVNAIANASGAGNGRKFKIEFWGRLTDSNSEPVKFAQKSLDIFANTVNVHEIRPNVKQ